MWQLATSPVPPPSAAPWTPAISGFVRRAPTVKSCSWTALSSVGIAPCSISARSMPAQKALPLAVSRMRRYGRIGGGIVQRRYQGAAEGGIEGVAFLGTIEGEAQQAPLANGMQIVGHCA